MTRKFFKPVRDLANRIIDCFIGRMRNGTSKKPKIYKASEQGVDREKVSSAAIKTCSVLQEAGYQAFIVGGGTRDLLLGLTPKDFDVATNANPDQVRRLFKRSRVIGRRFQIVHVLFGKETIEVTTFRSHQDNADTDSEGRVLRDNVWGSQADDAARRDFTVNALYYDPITDLLFDYHDGVRDLNARSLRIIGDPVIRYREDPVRMIRVARFAAKLGFTVDAETREPIKSLISLVKNVPGPRLFDEVIKLLTSGNAFCCLRQLYLEGLHRDLLPFITLSIDSIQENSFIFLALSNTDERVFNQKSISPGFLFAVLLWPEVCSRWGNALKETSLPIPALSEATASVLNEQAEYLPIPRRFIGDIREIWMMQPRFLKRTGRAPYRFLEHLRFRASYDFLILRCQAGECPIELAQWWEEFSSATQDKRDLLIEQVASSEVVVTKKRKNRKRKIIASSPPPSNVPG